MIYTTYDNYLLNKELDFIFNNLNEKINISSVIDSIKHLFDKGIVKSKEMFNKVVERFIKFMEKEPFGIKQTLLLSFIAMLLSMSSLAFYKRVEMVEDFKQEVNTMGYSDMLNIFEKESYNKIFDEYEKNANKYLNRDIFKGTPITGEMLRLSAEKTYNKHKVIVPLELALAQAQMESSMGRTGRSPKNNPYNVGEYDSHTYLKFGSTQKGIDAYYNLIAKDYLNNKKLDDLLNNFVNKDGNRYASDSLYEEKVKSQINYISTFFK